MKIYLYFKTDRGYYEAAYAEWRRQGGDFNAHLLRAQLTIYSWQAELERLGHTVITDLRSSYLLPQNVRCYLPLPVAQGARAALWASYLDPWLLHRDLIHRIVASHSDVAFFPLGSGVKETTLRALKRRGIKLAQWCGLPATTMLARDRGNLKYFDLIFTPANLEAGLRAAGAAGHIAYTPIGINPFEQRPVTLTLAERARFQSDVCFIGNLSPRFHSTRRAMVEYALTHGVAMKIWGGVRADYINSPILAGWQGQIWGKEVMKALCASKIGLNFHVDHQPGELNHGLNVRAFELPACGVFQLLQRVPSVSEFFQEDREIVCFDNQDEMLDKIHYYLTHEAERQAIAQAGYERVLRDHTWANRVERMAALMLAHLR